MENGEINIVVEEPREEEEGKNEATNEDIEEEEGKEPGEQNTSLHTPRDRNTLSSSPHSFNERTPLLSGSAPQGG